MTQTSKRLCLLAVVLLTCHASGSLAVSEHICIADWIPTRVGESLTAIQAITPGGDEAVPAPASTPGSAKNGVPSTTAADGMAPIRIKAFFTGGSCKEYGPHPKAKNGFIARYFKRSCEKKDVITEEKKKLLVERIVPAAVKLHEERLLVKRAAKIEVPFLRGICGEFNMPMKHMRGVSDADFVLYVSALPTFGSEHAWAMTCATLNGRPVVGVLNVGPDLIVDTQHSVRVVAHQIAHALGFTLQNMQKLKMLQEEKNVRGKASVLVVNTNKSLETMRKHYNCSTALGMELEDENMTMPIPSHWERRNAKDELMSAITGAGYYTALTLSLFEDMGFYTANFSMAEPMSWGNASSCTLLKDPCVKDGVTKHPEMFCTTRGANDCTSDRMGIGRCKIIRYTKDVLSPYQYFESHRESGDWIELTDHCPIIVPQNGTGCLDGDEKLMPGSLIGPGSRCLRGKGLKVDNKAVPAVCAKVACKNGTVFVLIRGGKQWHNCTANRTIVPEVISSEGSIMCPAYADVCTIKDDAENTEKGMEPVKPDEDSAGVAEHDDTSDKIPAGTSQFAGSVVRSRGRRAATNSLLPENVSGGEISDHETMKGKLRELTKDEGSIIKEDIWGTMDSSVSPTFPTPFVLLAFALFVYAAPL